MKIPSLSQAFQFLLLCVLAFAFFWRGGKGIEATWLLGAVGAILVIATLWHERRMSNGKDVPPELWSAVMLFLLWTIISYVLSLTQNYGLDEVLRDGTLFLLFFWMMRRSGADSSSKFAMRLIQLLVILTIVGCVIGVFVYVLQPVSRFVGTFFFIGHVTDYWPNAWAEMLLMTWPFVYRWSQVSKTPRSRIARDFVLGFVIGCLLLSFSRGGFLVFVIQCILLGALQWIAAGKKLEVKSTLRSFILVAALALVTFVSCNAARGQFHEVESVARKATFTADEGTSSLTERFGFFRQSFMLGAMRPLFGWGPYSFRFVQPRLEESVLATSDHPHNVFLKLMMERGVPSALFFLFIIAYVFWVAWRSPSHSKPVVIALFVSSVGVLLHNLIDYNLQFVAIVLPFMLLLGVLASPSLCPVPLTMRRVMRWTEAIIACSILIVVLFEGRMLVLSSLGRRAEAAKNTQAALSWYGQARGEWFSRDLELSRASLLESQTFYPDAKNAVESYIARNAEDARAWSRLADIEASMFNPSDALRDAEEAFLLGRFNDVSITTNYLAAYLRMGKTNTIQKDHDLVLQTFEEFRKAILANTHFIALSTNVEGFDVLSKYLEHLYPADATRIKAENAAVQSHAKQVRGEFTARTPGVLW